MSFYNLDGKSEFSIASRTAPNAGGCSFVTTSTFLSFSISFFSLSETIFLFSIMLPINAIFIFFFLPEILRKDLICSIRASTVSSTIFLLSGQSFPALSITRGAIFCIRKLLRNIFSLRFFFVMPKFFERLPYNMPGFFLSFISSYSFVTRFKALLPIQ